MPLPPRAASCGAPRAAQRAGAARRGAARGAPAGDLGEAVEGGVELDRRRHAHVLRRPCRVPRRALRSARSAHTLGGARWARVHRVLAGRRRWRRSSRGGRLRRRSGTTPRSSGRTRTRSARPASRPPQRGGDSCSEGAAGQEQWRWETSSTGKSKALTTTGVLARPRNEPSPSCPRELHPAASTCARAAPRAWCAPRRGGGWGGAGRGGAGRGGNLAVLGEEKGAGAAAGDAADLGRGGGGEVEQRNLHCLRHVLRVPEPELPVLVVPERHDLEAPHHLLLPGHLPGRRLLRRLHLSAHRERVVPPRPRAPRQLAPRAAGGERRARAGRAGRAGPRTPRRSARFRGCGRRGGVRGSWCRRRGR